jgi:hypothetical protein
MNEEVLYGNVRVSAPNFFFCNLCHPIFLNVPKSIFRTSMRVSKEYKNNQIFV